MVAAEDDMNILCDKVTVGSCIIVNEFDRPCARLVAVVTEIDHEKIVAQYLSNDVSLRTFSKNGVWGTFLRVTPLWNFGVALHVNPKGEYWCEKKCDSIATYPDGSHRLWQESFRETPLYPGRPEIVAILRAIHTEINNGAK